MSKKTVCPVVPGGFCAGVRGALDIFEETRKKFPAPVYVLHELVHNRRVGEKMRQNGAIFVDDLSQVPEGSVVLFGAHGVGRKEETDAAARHLHVIDAGCPRVKRLHRAASALGKDDELIIFGNPSHPEVRGVAGHAGTEKVFIVNSKEEIPQLPEMKNPTLLCQTTRDHLEIEEFTRLLKERFPLLHADGGVCDAVYRRQQAVEKMIPQVDVMLIAGSAHSSNANRMCDVARRSGKAAFLIDGAENLPDLSGFDRIGLGAGASTPDEIVQEILDCLIEKGYTSVEK